MKRTLLGAGAALFVCLMAFPAAAIDFKAKGQWIMSFDYGQHGNFMGSYKGHTMTGFNKSEGPLVRNDDFEARSRMRIGFDAIASESLSGTVYFEIGNIIWGKAAHGGALGSDGTDRIKLKHAYLDWAPPSTNLKVRMGIQNFALPAYASDNSILTDDMAGIVANYAINESWGVTAAWIRAYNDNYSGSGLDNLRANYLDNFDAVALLVPYEHNGFKVTPYGVYAGIGQNTFRSGDKYLGLQYGGGIGAGGPLNKFGFLPVGGALHRDGSSARNVIKPEGYATGWWGGISGDITAFSPFHFAFDFVYGSVQWPDAGRMNRNGWYGTLLAEYKLDWGIPGIYGWYSSGDDANPANGSERLPSIDSNTVSKYSHYANTGAPWIAREAVIAYNWAGTWGIGAHLKDMRFFWADFGQTLRVNLMGGTNSPTMAKKMSMNDVWANGFVLGEDGAQFGTDGQNIGMEPMYLTTNDKALEFNLGNTWHVEDHFKINLDMSYIKLWLDTGTSTWGARHTLGKSIPSTTDSWQFELALWYAF